MGVFKSKGRTVRLSESMLPLLDRLRHSLVHAEIEGSQTSPEVTDEHVVAFAMRAAALILTPRFAVINRDACAGRVDRELVMGMPNFGGCSEPKRLAMLDMILARSAEFSGFHPTSPLLAAKTEGERPS